MERKKFLRGIFGFGGMVTIEQKKQLNISIEDLII
jgi:hypothetical protein